MSPRRKAVAHARRIVMQAEDTTAMKWAKIIVPLLAVILSGGAFHRSTEASRQSQEAKDDGEIIARQLATEVQDHAHRTEREIQLEAINKELLRRMSLMEKEVGRSRPVTAAAPVIQEPKETPAGVLPRMGHAITGLWSWMWKGGHG